MENLLKLCLFLLCFETALTVQCILCKSYKNRECVDGIQTCTTQPDEMCMIRRTWYAFEIENLQSAESGCMKSCKLDEETSGDLTIHTHCCIDEDFCNDINLPIAMF
ncbi:LOC101824225 [Phodopus roborovskii]|uniref:LOC101824225 protein n=1 Tax=Phodopus roborovskii TaxID=109678 RepID=A0AAU9ZSI2_PHORO|nr:LOC101824225 [Phodopus roborovskii]